MASPRRVGYIIVSWLNQMLGAAKVRKLLAKDQPGLFAEIGALDWYSHSHRHWIDDLSFRPGDRVLEIGCAAGVLTSYIADSGCHVTGLDRSNDMIARARKDHPNLDLIVGDAMSLTFDDDTFDAVVASSVINVVNDAEAVLSEMRRVCMPGGMISVLVPSSEFTDEDSDALIENLGLTGFSRAAFEKWHRSAPKRSSSQLEALLEHVDLVTPVFRKYFDGMIVTATATSPLAFKKGSGKNREDDRPI